MENRLKYLQGRLEELRAEYKIASPSKKIFIEQGAKLIKSEMKGLEKKIANKGQGTLI